MAESPYSPGPWMVEHTLTAGLRIVHGPADPETGFRDDVPVGLGKLKATEEEHANVRLMALAPQMLDLLVALEWAGEDFPDRVDCCPNCGAVAKDPDSTAGFHYAHCELRDVLDAALGVTSQRVVHQAGAEAGR